MVVAAAAAMLAFATAAMETTSAAAVEAHRVAAFVWNLFLPRFQQIQIIRFALNGRNVWT